MEQMITLRDNSQFPVSARELHEKLNIVTPYTMWFPRMCEYGFAEKVDFNSHKNVRVQNEGDRTVSREVVDHMVTLSMAKELCMLQRSEMGRQVRRYLIAIEEQWNSPEQLMARALKMADRAIHQLTGQVTKLEDTIHQKDQVIGELRPKADYVDHILSSKSAMATAQISADYGLTPQKLNKMLHEARIQKKIGGQWILYAEHMGKGYTKSETIPIERSSGFLDTILHTKWTQKGRLLINDVLNQQGIYANMDRETASASA